MLNFYYQVGYSGLFILLLGLIAVFMTIRGSVLLILIYKQAKTPHKYSIIHHIIEVTTSLKNSNLQAHVPPSSSKETIVLSNSALEKVSPELIINTLMQEQMKGIYSSMYFLKLCAAIAPLLGLLGTVIGMVDVFSTLSEKAMPDPSLLAGGIWQALLTTVMGLTLAIPSLIVHYILLMSLRSIRNRILLEVNHIKLK